jgi:hypothetical protein
MNNVKQALPCQTRMKASSVLQRSSLVDRSREMARATGDERCHWGLRHGKYADWGYDAQTLYLNYRSDMVFYY